MARPLKYKTEEELQEAIDTYFASAGDYPTVSGLALHLGFAHRKSITDYKQKDRFSNTVKRAVLKIESIHEANLYKSACTGSIFWLKNRQWSDKQEIDHTSNGESITLPPWIKKLDE